MKCFESKSPAVFWGFEIVINHKSVEFVIFYVGRTDYFPGQ